MVSLMMCIADEELETHATTVFFYVIGEGSTARDSSFQR
jgi:hypothetical protein